MHVDLPSPSINVQSKDREKHKTIFLLGAGASVPADIPSIEGLTQSFWKNSLGVDPKTKINWEKHRAPIKFLDLTKICRSEMDRFDLETMMSLLVKLENKKYKDTLSFRYKELKTIGQESILDFKNKIQEHIRTNCEKIKNFDYFWGIEGFIQNDKPLKIFTLNYDGVLEVFCRKNNISYTDGFNPFWNSKDFTKEYQIHLYKLHGSLYWFKAGNGTFIKIPIKGLQIKNLKYLTDDTVSEMMIYPELEKNKQQIVYSSLFQTFREELVDSSFCVVIGYSFRDKEIKESIVEALSGNPNLWLILVDPRASSIKHSQFPRDDEILSRIVTLDYGVKEALGDRKLYANLEHIKTARDQEDLAKRAQSRTLNRLDRDWHSPIINYLSVGHYDRVKLLTEWLLDNNFDGVSGTFPDTLDADLCAYSLKYLLEYRKINHLKKMSLWKRFFLLSYRSTEYVFFNHKDELRDHNPIQSQDMVKKMRNSSSSSEYVITNIQNQTQSLLPTIKDESIKNCVEKIIQTCKLLTLKKNISPEGNSWNSVTPQEIIDGYRNEDLGLGKWAERLVDELEKNRHSKAVKK